MVTIVIWLRTGQRGFVVLFPDGLTDFSPLQNIRSALVTQSPTKWGTRCSFLGLKRSERESDRSPASSTDFFPAVFVYLTTRCHLVMK